MTGRKLAVAIDESELSTEAAHFVTANLLKDDDEIHLLGVTTPPAYTTGALPLATATAATATYVNYEQQRKEDEKLVRTHLAQVKADLANNGLSEEHIHTHVLPGGSIGGAIVSWAQAAHPDLVVVGSRGLGALKATAMSLVGLGSVSSHCVHNLHTPVCVVRKRSTTTPTTATTDTAPKPASSGKKVLVSVDDSKSAKHALEYAVVNVLKPEDELHLVSVALPVPFPVSPEIPKQNELWDSDAIRQRDANDDEEELRNINAISDDDFRAQYRGALETTQQLVSHTVLYTINTLKIVTDDSSAAHVLEVQEVNAHQESTMQYARETVKEAVDLAAQKVPRDKIFYKAMEPEGGASDIGMSLKHYAESNGIDMVVLGARGMGGMKRAIMNIIGLGSVSDWCVSNMECPVLIVKQ